MASSTAIIVEKFVAGLKSRNEETRARATRDLKQYVSTELKEALSDELTVFLEEFNQQIVEMVSSQDVNEKKGGILAISMLIDSSFSCLKKSLVARKM